MRSHLRDIVASLIYTALQLWKSFNTPSAGQPHRFLKKLSSNLITETFNVVCECRKRKSTRIKTISRAYQGSRVDAGNGYVRS